MARMRIIKRKDGVIQTQHRTDERYTDQTLPPGTTASDVDAEVVVDPRDLVDVEDAQAQLDIVNGHLRKDLTRKPLRQQIAEKKATADTALADLDADADVPAAVKKYLVALRDVLNAGPGKLSHPQSPNPHGRN